MAAFPGLSAAGARRNARFEAVERWSLAEWWAGRLPAASLPLGAPGARALRIGTPFDEAAVVLLWRGPGADGPAAFGFAAAGDPHAAAQKAGVELTRNLQVLARAAGAPPSAVNERRLLYFSGADGFASFSARVEASLRWTAPPAAKPRPSVDCELPGPWSRYASVWRVLYPAAGPDDFQDDSVFRF